MSNSGEDVSFELSDVELAAIATGTTRPVEASTVTTSAAFTIVNAPVAKPIPSAKAFTIVNAPVAKPIPSAKAFTIVNAPVAKPIPDAKPIAD